MLDPRIRLKLLRHETFLRVTHILPIGEQVQHPQDDKHARVLTNNLAHPLTEVETEPPFVYLLNFPKISVHQSLYDRRSTKDHKHGRSSAHQQIDNERVLTFELPSVHFYLLERVAKHCQDCNREKEYATEAHPVSESIP